MTNIYDSYNKFFMISYQLPVTYIQLAHKVHKGGWIPTCIMLTINFKIKLVSTRASSECKCNLLLAPTHVAHVELIFTTEDSGGSFCVLSHANEQ